MNRRTPLLRLLPAAAAASALLVPALASAKEQIFRYEDDDGVMVISNVAPGKAAKRGLKMKKSGDLVEITAPVVASVARRSPGEYMAHVEEACELYKIPKALALAVMAVESNFNPAAVSHAGATGLMQLMPQTAAEMFVSDILDPRQNIHGGVRYLRVLANMFNGDMVQILAAYNAGPDAVRRAGGAIPKITETQEYVRKVIKLYYAYKDELGAQDSERTGL
ncbi:MAG: lytic transglycosylase domain-containing protein [Myxococcales bacterium]